MACIASASGFSAFLSFSRFELSRAAVAIGLGIVLLFYAYPDALLTRLAIYEETLMPNSPTSELMNRSWDYPVRNFLGAFTFDR